MPVTSLKTLSRIGSGFGKKLCITAALTLSTVGTALAHPMWMLPHEFNLSGDDAEWITVDATASHTLFNYDKGLPLDRVRISAPDGSEQRVGSYFKGHRRSVFDLKIDQPGTWKLSGARPPVFITNYVAGKRNAEKRLFADKQAAKDKLPKDAREVKTSLYMISTISFVTWQAPDNKVLELKNKGLELAGSTHPNDVITGEEAEFQLFLDGKPQANVEVELTPNGTKYRDDRKMIKLTTDKNGMLIFTPDIAGPWYMAASTELKQKTAKADSVRHVLYMTFESQLP